MLLLFVAPSTHGPASADGSGPTRPAPPAAAGAMPAATPAPPPNLTPEQAADAVLAARLAKDDAAVATLASKDQPDPWLVVDVLLARGKGAAADAFAGASPRKDVEGLHAFVVARTGRPVDPAARALLSASIAAVGEGSDARAIETLAVLPADDPIAAVRMAHVRGLALRNARRLAESSEAFAASGTQARAIGWLARADRAMDEAGTSAMLAAEWRRALAAWEERMAIATARGDRAGIASTLGKMGSISSRLSDYPRALELAEQALKVYEGLGDRPGIAEALGQVGAIHQLLGDYPRALEVQERALALRRQLGDRAGIAEALGSMGKLTSALGDYPGALEYEEQALKLQEELGDTAAIARTLGAIGNIRHYLGDCRGAIEVQGKALKLMEDLGDASNAALTLGTIGAIHCSLQDYPKALEIQERALVMKEAAGDRAGVASSLENIGLIHQSQGDLPKALTYYERALTLREQLGDRAGVATVLGSIGLIHESLKDFEDAVETQERALIMAERVGSQELVLERLSGLASTHLARGDAERAAEMAHRAVEVLGRLATGLADEQGTNTREQYERVFEIGTKAAAQLDDAAEATFFLESGRAATLLEALGGRDALRAFVIPDELRMEEAKARAEEAQAQEAHLDALERGLRAEIRSTKQALTTSQNKVGDVIKRIQRQAKAAASVVYPKADTLEVIRARLRPADALVLYGVFSDVALGLVMTAKDARIVALGDAKALEEACRAEDWSTVRKRALDPLGIPAAVGRLIISPMGALATVPFCVLAPEREIVYVPSGTTYGVILDESIHAGELVLALGDPDYGHKEEPREGAPSRRRAALAPLPGTREEAKAVGDLLLLGADASEARLRDKLQSPTRWHAVHLACHGILNRDMPKLSSLALSKGDFLTMIEVFRLKVQADLCVLSACETARGKIFSTEGVEGFVRAFLFAGAPRVIVSLWKVDDDATRALMTRFYELWNPDKGKTGIAVATALRQAQEFVRSQAKWKDPVYWAAWQLWGLPD